LFLPFGGIKMIGIFLTLLIADVNWSQIDAKQYLPLQVGNWWEYVSKRCCNSCPPPPPDYHEIEYQDTIRCTITKSELIFNLEWFYFDNCPLCLPIDVSSGDDISLHVRYNENSDLVGCDYVDAWDWCKDIMIFPLTELISNIINERYESYLECNISKLYHTDYYSGGYICTSYYMLLYIPELSKEETDIIYGRPLYNCNYVHNWLKYNFGLTEIVSKASNYEAIWNDWHCTRAVVNGVYYSNVEDAKPTTWQNVKSEK
jgi:hypothetical protein